MSVQCLEAWTSLSFHLLQWSHGFGPKEKKTTSYSSDREGRMAIARRQRCPSSQADTWDDVRYLVNSAQFMVVVKNWWFNPIDWKGAYCTFGTIKTDSLVKLDSKTNITGNYSSTRFRLGYPQDECVSLSVISVLSKGFEGCSRSLLFLTHGPQLQTSAWKVMRHSDWTVWHITI